MSGRNNRFLSVNLILAFIALLLGIVALGYLYYRHYEKSYRAEEAFKRIEWMLTRKTWSSAAERPCKSASEVNGLRRRLGELIRFPSQEGAEAENREV